MGRHQDKVVIVTGAGSGIGRATAELLLRQGASVVAADLTAESLAWCEDEAKVITVPVDVTETTANDLLTTTAVDGLGGLDGAVFNAGVSMSGSITDLPFESFDRAMEVNVRAVAMGIRAVVPTMQERGGGSIVVTASTSGQRGDPNMWAYNSSKAAVINLVRSVALDLGIHGIRVNAVAPGPTETGMTAGIKENPGIYDALRRRTARQKWATADEVAAVFGFLLSDDASAVTGTVVNADGGISANTGQFLPPEGARQP